MMQGDFGVAWEIMKWPLAACLILPPLLVYLGLHVVRREVIFVDLSLAQIAASPSPSRSVRTTRQSWIVPRPSFFRLVT